MTETSPRNVVVTGAASGIGRGIAIAFAENGDRVFACDISASRLAEAMPDFGPEAVAGTVDVTDFRQVREFVREADSASEDGLFAIVNNAGIFDGYASILETSDELWDQVLGINLKGCFNGSKAAVEKMLPRGRGRVINMGSIASFRGGPDGLSYSASKAGIVGLTRRLAFEVARHGLTANVVAPGVVATGLRDNTAEILGTDPNTLSGGYSRGLSQETLDWILPARRKGTVEEVAAATLFFASPGAAYVNGETISVDGGMIAV